MRAVTQTKKPEKKGKLREYSERMARILKKKFNEAVKLFGDGNVGLLPKKRPGNRLERFAKETLDLAREVIKAVWMTKKMKSKKAAFGEFLLQAKGKGLERMSYKKFLELIKDYPQYEIALNREGRRAAYKHEPFCYRLTMEKGRHGNRPWEVCHIDHTLLDIELKSSKGVLLGRPWITILMDAFSRRVLALYVTFDPPSYRSCMMVIRECVRRFGRLPQTIVVDGGREFGSAYFEMLLARYSVTKKVRPAAKARFGSVLERIFGTMNTQLVHNLLGSTKIMKNVRQVTKANNPKNEAVWTLEELYVALCEWAYETYDTQEHPSLDLQSPRQAYEEGMEQFGSRSHRFIPYDDNFIMMTLPSTPKETAKIDQTRGIKINGIYYWNDILLEDPQLANKQVEVRYDPYNRGVAYVYVNDEWTKCLANHFDEFEGRTDKEIQLRSEELRRVRYLHGLGFEDSAEALATQIRTNEAKEVVMKQQQRDEESRRVEQRREHNSQPHKPAVSDKRDSKSAGRRHGKNRHNTAETQPKSNIRYGRF